MAARYVDVSAIIQVIGNIYNNVSLLDFEDYHFNEDDFPEQFHKILFGSIFNLHALGAKEITLNAIEDYLTQRPNSYAVYKTNKGHEYLEQISQQVDAATFEYYYNRMKKFTLLRMYHEKCGMDLSSIYDIDNILNVKKKQLQEDWLDNTSLEDCIIVANYAIDAIKAGVGVKEITIAMRRVRTTMKKYHADVENEDLEMDFYRAVYMLKKLGGN